MVPPGWSFARLIMNRRRRRLASTASGLPRWALMVAARRTRAGKSTPGPATWLASRGGGRLMREMPSPHGDFFDQSSGRGW